MTQLWMLGATELGTLIKSGQITCQEVIEAFLQRIQEVNPQVNGVTVTLEQTALSAAAEYDRKIRRRSNALREKPLLGIPITVKENQDVAGSATTQGISPLRNHIAEGDAPHIAQLRRAGAIPIARTNMPEFGMRWHTHNGLYGHTKNPHDHSLTPGGSSGGEAAALASGMSSLGIGNDGAGSLRWPAQCCGVAALKPSQGRIPIANTGTATHPIPAAFQVLSAHGPMARQVKDLTLAFAHMCAEPSSDPWHVVAPISGPQPSSPLPVGRVCGLELDSRVSKAMDLAARMLADAGHPVENVELPDLHHAGKIYVQIMGQYGRLTPQPKRAPVGVISAEYNQFWEAFDAPWSQAQGDLVHDPLMARGEIYAQWHDQLTRTPLLLVPIATIPAWPVGSDLDREWLARWLTQIHTITVVNLLGLPAVAVPVANIAGLPQSVQIISRRFREDLCLEAAQTIEDRANLNLIASKFR